MAKIIFMGTPNFAVSALKELKEAGHEIQLVLCQPDKKQGRGRKLQAPPVKQYALEQGLDVYQPVSVRKPDVIEKLAVYQPDFMVVIAYGKILPKAVLDIPAKACINVHASLLPKWRGAAPIQFSLIAGDQETGVVTMLMDEQMDTGDMLEVAKTQIDPNETAVELSERLSEMGSRLIVNTIENFDSIAPVPQEHSEATFTRLLKKEDQLIDWEKSAREIYNLFRGLYPAGLTTRWREKKLILNKIEPLTDKPEGTNPGDVALIEKSSFIVSCGTGALRIYECKPESKKLMSAKDIINGYQLKLAEKLG